MGKTCAMPSCQWWRATLKLTEQKTLNNFTKGGVPVHSRRDARVV
jgi:hypothetical protein